jgi:predicted TIM-barrel fold metal-dependent hydrolase
MRIDAHVHFTPPSLRDEIQPFAEREPYWGMLLQPGEGARSIQGWAYAEQMLVDMDLAQLDRVIIQAEYPQKFETAVERNTQILALMEKWPERISAMAALHPSAGRKAVYELERCVEGGMMGAGELNPYAQGFTLDDPDFIRIVERLIQLNLPLNLHVSEPVGPYYLGRSVTPLDRIFRLAERYPDLKLILSHWGGGLVFYELNPRIQAVLRNVYYDTAATPLQYRVTDIFEAALRIVGAGKILYGSDYPLLLYPRRQSQPDFTSFLKEIESAEINQADKMAILGGNAARVMGWVEAGSSSIADLPAPTPAIFGPDLTHLDRWAPVSAIAQRWPATQRVFAKFGIRWRDEPVPYWEPLEQAAAVRGLGPNARNRLLDELNEVIADRDET